MRDDMLKSILSDLNGSSADIEASAVISTDGLMMASLLPAGLEEERIGAMTAAMLALGTRSAEELGRGTLEQVLLKGDHGYVLMTGAGHDAVLAVLAKTSAKLGLIFLDVRRAAEAAARVV
jgi:predicted regulator of Ras-like GTPase activity (Roadblock/LC7/MglB family)